jgi:hypothetical protein
MMILRCTTKAFQKFGKQPQLIECDRTEKDFGQWYVNTVDSVKRGNLFTVAMHADSLYAMLVPIEKGMGSVDYLHTIFANLLLRLLLLEVPRNNAEQIMNSYNSQAVFAKTNSRNLVAHLATIIKDIDARLEYPEDLVKGNQLELTRLENDINDIPRTFQSGHVWPLDAFYKCIRTSCPELPFRKSLPFKHQAMGQPEMLMDIFDGRLSEKLAVKIKASSQGAGVLFCAEEVRTILTAVEDSHRHPQNIPGKIYDDLLRMLTLQVQKFEEQA